MGENRAMGESTLGKFGVNAVCRLKNNHVQITGDSLYLHSFLADTLKYVHLAACCCNKCKFDSTLEAALMVWSTAGEINA